MTNTSSLSKIPVQIRSALSGWSSISHPKTDRVFTAQAVKDYENTLKSSGVSEYSLMRKAAAAAFRLIQNRWRYLETLQIFCGPGHNAGDGYALAAIAQQNGYRCQIFHFNPPQKPLPQKMLDWAQETGVETILLPENLTELTNTLSSVATAQQQILRIDALFGIGLNRALTPPIQQLIQWLNEQKHDEDMPTLSLDIPSGLAADTGNVETIAIEATATLTFLAIKAGLLTHWGPHYTGDIYFHDLISQLPKAFDDCQPSPKLATLETWHLSPNDKKTLQKKEHKNSRGEVLIWAGEASMQGAGILACKGALAAGCGKVRWLGNHQDIAQLPQILTGDLKDFETYLAQASSVVIGLGIEPSDQNLALAKTLIKACQALKTPVVVDAGLLPSLEPSSDFSDHILALPHPGEAATLLKTSNKAIQNDRFNSVRQLVDTYGCHFLLKGAGTLIADEKSIRLSPYGNGSLATAGSGDVLAGVAGALLARGISTNQAAVLATGVCGLSADRLAAIQGPHGLILDDLCRFIAQQWD